MSCELAAQKRAGRAWGLTIGRERSEAAASGPGGPAFPEVEENADTKNFSRDLGGAPIGAWKEARPGDNIA